MCVKSHLYIHYLVANLVQELPTIIFSYVYMHIVCMLCMYVNVNMWIFICMRVWKYASLYEYIFVYLSFFHLWCMHICIHVYVCMYVCILDKYVTLCMYVSGTYHGWQWAVVWSASSETLPAISQSPGLSGSWAHPETIYSWEREYGRLTELLYIHT